MDAIVTAGGIPQPQDPLYTYSNGDSKALIDLAGKPMIQWVLDALGDAQQVDNVIVIGLTAKSGVTCKKPLYFLSNQGRMLANIVVGVNKSLELNKRNQYVLIVSSDVPTIKSEMVDWVISSAMETRDDLYYGVCDREVMETRFPGSRRTYTKLKDIELCGADVHVSHVSMATEHLDTWEQLIGSRKSPLKQARKIGIDTFFKVLTKSITLDELVTTVCTRIGIKGRAIKYPFAEPCMDVDKPGQLEMLRADLENQVNTQSVEKKKKAASRPKKAAAPKSRSVKPRTKAKPTAK